MNSDINQLERSLKIVLISMGVGMLVQVISLFTYRLLPSFKFRYLFSPLVKAIHLVIPAENTFAKDTSPENIQLPFHSKLSEENEFIHIQTTIPQHISFAMADLQNNKIIAGKDTHVPKSIASLTKIMSAIIVQDLLQPTETLTVSESATKQIPTKLGLQVGDKFSVTSLLSAALLTSANDATQVLAEGVEEKYPNESFVSLMNKKATYLQLEHTSFQNPQGFDDVLNKSTPHDMLQLTSYVWANYPSLREIVQDESHFIKPIFSTREYELLNWNSLVGLYPGCVGLKIGNTDNAKKTMIAVATREKHTLAVVVLGAENELERDLITARLFDEGFSQAYSLDPANISEQQLLLKYSTWKRL